MLVWIVAGLLSLAGALTLGASGAAVSIVCVIFMNDLEAACPKVSSGCCPPVARALRSAPAVHL